MEINTCEIAQDSLVSRLPAHNIRTYTTYPISVILKEIQRGDGHIPRCHDGIVDKTLRGITQHARDVLGLDNIASEAAYQNIKKGMPAICPAGILNEDSELVEMSMLGCLDIDEPDDIAEALVIATQIPYTVAAFRTLRNTRMKVLFRIAPTSNSGQALDHKTYKYAWFAGSIAYEELGGIDGSGAEATHLCALVHDPNVYINLDAIPMHWDVDFTGYYESHPHTTRQLTETSALASLPAKYRDAIREMDWNEKEWGTLKLPCLWGRHENDGWGLRTNGMGVHRNGVDDYTFNCLKCPAGQKKRRYSKSQRVHRSLQRVSTPNLDTNTLPDVDTNAQQVEDRRATLGTNLSSIFSDIDAARRSGNTDIIAFLVKGFTGLGKSTGMKNILAANMNMLIENQVAIISVSLNADVREQDYFDMLKTFSPDHVVNWKGRAHNYHLIENLPRQIRLQDETLFNKALCPNYDEVEKAQARNIPAFEICKRCQLYDACKQYGYWQQYEALVGALYICISLQDALDPMFHNFLKELQRRAQQKIDTLLFDDYTLNTLLCDVPLSSELLVDAMKNRKQGRSHNVLNAGFFLETLVNACIQFNIHNDTGEFYRKMKRFVDPLTEEERHGIREGLSLCVYDGEEISPSDLLDKGVALSEIPMTWNITDSLLDRVLYFLQDNTEQNANVTETTSKDMWLTHKPRLRGSGIKYLLMFSATTEHAPVKKCLTDDIKVRTYEIDVPTQLALGNRCFQFEGSLVTTQSVFIYEDGEVVGLTPTAERDILKHCSLVEKEKQGTGHRAIWISHMDFMNTTLAHSPAVQRLHEVFDTLTYYQRVTGINWEDYNIFICYGLPKSRMDTIYNLARGVYSNDTDKLPTPQSNETMHTDLTQFERLEKHGMEHGRNVFSDNRQEQMRQHLVDALLQQGAGRARLFVWENRLLIVHCNTIIEETFHAQLYTRGDLHEAFTIEDLSELADIREKQAQEAQNQAQEKAYEKVEHATRNLEIVHLFDVKDWTQQQIADKFGISRQRVGEILSRYHP